VSDERQYTREEVRLAVRRSLDMGIAILRVQQEFGASLGVGAMQQVLDVSKSAHNETSLRGQKTYSDFILSKLDAGELE